LFRAERLVSTIPRKLVALRASIAWTLALSK
jgi:hypothetical protein